MIETPSSLTLLRYALWVDDMRPPLELVVDEKGNTRAVLKGREPSAFPVGDLRRGDHPVPGGYDSDLRPEEGDILGTSGGFAIPARVV